MKTLFPLSLLLLAGALAGCADPIKPPFEVEGHRMLIVPMKDRIQYHFESERGVRLAQAITERLEERRKEMDKDECIEVIPFEDLRAAVHKVHDDPKNMKFEDLGRSVKADLVLIGDITNFQTRLPGDVGISRGKASVSIRIIATAKPDRNFLKPRTISVVYPPEKYGTGVGDEPEEEIEAGLFALLVDEISQIFYVHEPEKSRK